MGTMQFPTLKDSQALQSVILDLGFFLKFGTVYFLAALCV